MNFILVSSALEKKMAKKLSDFGTVVPLPPLPALPSPIASHADTLIASVGDEFFVYANYPESDKLFAALDFPCTVIKQNAGNKYPLDAALNCFTVGDRLVCREKSVAPEILDFAKKRGYKTINVKQGYAHCSCAVIGDGILTSDRGIFRVAEKEGIDSAFVSSTGIVLPGYKEGFIGFNIQEPLYSMRDDRNALSRRTLNNRKNEIRVKKNIMKWFELPASNYIYVLIPVIKLMMPGFVYKLAHKNK